MLSHESVPSLVRRTVPDQVFDYGQRGLRFGTRYLDSRLLKYKHASKETDAQVVLIHSFDLRPHAVFRGFLDRVQDFEDGKSEESTKSAWKSLL